MTISYTNYNSKVTAFKTCLGALGTIAVCALLVSIDDCNLEIIDPSEWTLLELAFFIVPSVAAMVTAIKSIVDMINRTHRKEVRIVMYMSEEQFTNHFAQIEATGKFLTTKLSEEAEHPVAKKMMDIQVIQKV